DRREGDDNHSGDGEYGEARECATADPSERHHVLLLPLAGHRPTVWLSAPETLHAPYACRDGSRLWSVLGEAGRRLAGMSELQLRRPDGLGTRGERSYLEADVEIRVLGSLEVASAGADIQLGGRKQRTVLALLVAEVGKPVTVDALIDGVWGEEPTPGARSTLQT